MRAVVHLRAAALHRRVAGRVTLTAAHPYLDAAKQVRVGVATIVHRHEVHRHASGYANAQPVANCGLGGADGAQCTIDRIAIWVEGTERRGHGRGG